MKPVLLLMDNFEKYLSTTARLLESEGYQVEKALTLEAAHDVLDRGRVHLALLDVRMLDNFDPLDRSGLAFAQLPEYASLPKMIINEHDTVELAVEALGPLDGRRAIIDYVAKRKGWDYLKERVRMALETHVRIRWDLDLRWGEAGPRSFVHLAALSEPAPDPHCLPGRTGELQDLFGQLFYAWERVLVARLLWAQGGVWALHVCAACGDGREEWLVVGGHKPAVEVHSADWQALPDPALAFAAAAQTLHFAGIAWQLPGGTLEQTLPFPAFFGQSRERVVKVAFTQLLDRCQSGWAAGHLASQPPASAPEPAGPDVPALLAQAVRAQLLQSASLESGLLKFVFPGGKNYTCPAPSAWPASHTAAPISIPTFESVLVDHAGTLWFAPPPVALWLPPVVGLAALEAAVHFRLLDLVTLLTRFDLIAQACQPPQLARPLSPGSVEPSCARALVALTEIRQLAATRAAGAGYGQALYDCGLSHLSTYDPARLYTLSELGAYLSALFLCGTLAPALQAGPAFQSPGAPQPAPLLSLDDKRQQVCLGAHRHNLTPTEFRLLAYLSHHTDRVCTRDELLAEVFKFPAASSDAQKSLLNTQVLRLRKKIEPDPSRPCYLITVRGGGYRLILDPTND